MELVDIINKDCILPCLQVNSKRLLLQKMAALAAKKLGGQEDVFLEALMAREKLGSTGVGHGVAIPHARIKGLGSIHGFFARLFHPVDFDALDGEPIDLVFMLLVDEDAGANHLKILSKVSRLLRDGTSREALRGATTAEALYSIIVPGDSDEE